MMKSLTLIINIKKEKCFGFISKLNIFIYSVNYFRSSNSNELLLELLIFIDSMIELNISVSFNKNDIPLLKEFKSNENMNKLEYLMSVSDDVLSNKAEEMYSKYFKSKY